MCWARRVWVFGAGALLQTKGRRESAEALAQAQERVMLLEAELREVAEQLEGAGKREALLSHQVCLSVCPSAHPLALPSPTMANALAARWIAGTDGRRQRLAWLTLQGRGAWAQLQAAEYATQTLERRVNRASAGADMGRLGKLQEDNESLQVRLQALQDEHDSHKEEFAFMQRKVERLQGELEARDKARRPPRHWRRRQLSRGRFCVHCRIRHLRPTTTEYLLVD